MRKTFFGIFIVIASLGFSMDTHAEIYNGTKATLNILKEEKIWDYSFIELCDNQLTDDMEEVAKGIGDELGIEEMPRIIVGMESGNTGGGYNIFTNEIVINPLAVIDWRYDNAWFNIVSILSHEMRHAYQWQNFVYMDSDSQYWTSEREVDARAYAREYTNAYIDLYKERKADASFFECNIADVTIDEQWLQLVGHKAQNEIGLDISIGKMTTDDIEKENEYYSLYVDAATAGASIDRDKISEIEDNGGIPYYVYLGGFCIICFLACYVLDRL